MFLERSQEKYEYSPEDLESYQPPVDFLAKAKAACSPALQGQVQQRWEAIATEKPGGPR